ncbi:hypothetical protein NYG85_11945 [Campylobacter sp. PS10]|uniref:Uncharacterized protein n=2 Tax=Campylobacter gastrosuis TaxID=2974576 RepID=A0ABT7HT18_9BACT|nr:hypothetical protein [Campylobacter gastrosuis]MDL0090067.1 hypothetical protein [Campylobacter gastrosuis]
MGADFNKAAGLPSDFKIHKKTLDDIVDFNEISFYNKPTKNAKVFENLDVADTNKQWCRILTKSQMALRKKKRALTNKT